MLPLRVSANHEETHPDGAGEDSSAAGRLDETRLRVTVEAAEALEAAAALTSRYLISVLTRGEVNAAKQNQAATQRLKSNKD